MVNVKGSSHKHQFRGHTSYHSPHHDIQHHQKEDKENDNKIFFVFSFFFFQLILLPLQIF